MSMQHALHQTLLAVLHGDPTILSPSDTGSQPGKAISWLQCSEKSGHHEARQAECTVKMRSH